FPHTLMCSLNNTSLVPMTFKLRVRGDGDGQQSIPSYSQESDSKRWSWINTEIPTTKPKEFTITPSSGTIRAQGFAAIKVTLCSNTVQKYELVLVVDVEGIGEEVLALLITARCVVPTLQLVTTEVNFGRCFLKYPYEKTIQLVNHDDLPGCYKVLPQLYENPPAVLLSSPAPCGVISPHSTVHIPLALETQVTGEHRSTVYISVFGSQDTPLACHIHSTGEGPVIFIHPTQVDFGNIYVLKDTSRILQLSNQSFIPALFRVRMAKKKSLWTVTPSEGMVPAEDDFSLTLTANLDDIVTFRDTVILEVEHSNTYRIPVQATGIGSTIVSDKPFAPELNLGAHFSLDTHYYCFKLTNKGRRVQQLFWMNDEFHPEEKQSKKEPKKKGPTGSRRQSQNYPETTDTGTPVFQIHPVRMELYPGQTVDVILEGYSAIPRKVKERLVCHAIIGAQKGKSLLISVNIICEFIAPLIQLSTRQLIYRLEKKPNTVLEPDYQPLTIKNITTLPVNMMLSTTGPFFICDTDKSLLPATPKPIKLEVNEEKNLLVKFDTSYRNDLNNWVAEEVLSIKYVEHPQVDSLCLRGEVHYPNLSFEMMEVDFGCILNDTELIRYITITNCSPLIVRFRWFFLVDDDENQIRFAPCIKPYSACMSQMESIPATSVTASSPAAPTMVDSAEVAFSDSIKTILMDDEAGPEEREIKKPTASTMIAEAIKYSSAETDRSQSQADYPESLWIFEQEEMLSIGIEEVFDILPLYGVMRPYSSHQISFTFYGHCDIIAQAKALCEVEGGPTYEIILKGEASLVGYSFDTKDINYGLQLFDHVTEREITLKNIGKVGFEFKVLTNNQSSPKNLLPGAPLILPLSINGNVRLFIP
ncbi:hypothetical protein STEG23_011292, partial [Scotinomys teguina]